MMAEEKLREALLLELQMELSVLTDSADPITGSDEHIVDRLLQKIKKSNRWSVFSGLFLALAMLFLWYIIVVREEAGLNDFMPFFWCVSGGFFVGYGLGFKKASRTIERCISVIQNKDS